MLGGWTSREGKWYKISWLGPYETCKSGWCHVLYQGEYGAKLSDGEWMSPTTCNATSEEFGNNNNSDRTSATPAARCCCCGDRIMMHHATLMLTLSQESSWYPARVSARGTWKKSRKAFFPLWTWQFYVLIDCMAFNCWPFQTRPHSRCRRQTWNLCSEWWA